MEAADFFTFEARLASFQKTSKKRGSAPNGRGGKVLNWPHKSITPESLAKAGFYFSPTPENPDNAICFLCEKSMDGWEAGDNPVQEHVSHSTECGWAIVAAIEAEIGDYVKQDPGHADMVAARKATFAGRWPHDGKRAWKCKTKQLVEAGWKYTPMIESDDMATCTYCELALDGWESSDKPYDEHQKRSPHCPFFALMSEFEGTRKKTRGRAARGSKTSRLSIQSTATAASEATTIDLTADAEDSIMTTAPTATQGPKRGRPKKAATGKGTKGKAKRKEPVQSADPEEVTDNEAPPPPPPPAKSTRGKKRGSEAVEDSVTILAGAPAPKRRATKNRDSAATAETSVMTQDSDMTDVPASKKPVARKKGRASNKTGRKGSGTQRISNAASMASLRAPPMEFPDDDEIERQLEADLARQYSDDDEMTFQTAAEKSSNFAMFAPIIAETDDAAIEDELQALEAEMNIDEPEQLQVPKKGRKTGTRKASKQKKSTKTKAPSPPPESERSTPGPKPIVQPEVEMQQEAEAEEEGDASIGSTDTVVKKQQPSQVEPPKKRGRGRPPKASLASATSETSVEFVEAPEQQPEPEQPVKRGRGRPSNASLNSEGPIKAGAAPVKKGRGRPSKESIASQNSADAKASNAGDGPAKRARGRPRKTKAEEATVVPVKASKAPLNTSHIYDDSMEDDEISQPMPMVVNSHAQAPSTPTRIISPAQSARQPVISPSQSPQSSDAENQPPSSKPTHSSTTKRIALAPVNATPMRMSPSKRNVLAGLQSSTPWTAANLDTVFGTPRDDPNKENGVERFLRQGKDLTSPEKQMTVEEWVYYNASEAEKKLKHECETMVNKFETEGSKAMRVLEGLAAE